MRRVKRQCNATTRQGLPCKRPAIPGGAVCLSHGGGAPQVVAKAKLRLLRAVDPTIDRLIKVIQTSKHDPSVVSACKDLLDRAGLKPVDKVELEAVSVLDPGRNKLSDEDLQRLIETARQLKE